MQVLSGNTKEIEDMISYLTQSHILIKYSKNNRRSVLLVYFNENLQKLIFEISKQTRKIVMLSDIYHSEPGFSKELLLTLQNEDIKNSYGMKILTKKRVIELSATHKIERDTFVKNLNLLIRIMKEWKSTRGLRNYFERSLDPIDGFLIEKKTNPLNDLESQIVLDVVNEIIEKIELRALVNNKKMLHNQLKLIEYENRYLLDQSNIFENQLKDKDRALEGTLTTYTYLQHKFYLRSICSRSEKIQEFLRTWRKILEYLNSLDLFEFRRVNKVFLKLTNNHLSLQSSWARLSYSGLKPRKYMWQYYLQNFHPYSRSKSSHYSAEVSDEIRKDVYRGLPDRFKEVEEALTTICSLNYEVGYCQGMQLVTHFLLTIYNDGDQVVETLKSLMEPPYFMAEIWKNGFCRLKLAIFQLEALASLKLPYLLEHLKKIEINLDIIITPWIVTLFTHMMYQQKIPFETIKQIWDVFIVSGWPVLISTSLALLYLCLDKIIGKTLEETLNVFSSGIPVISLNTIKKFHVDPSFLDQLENSFNLQNL